MEPLAPPSNRKIALHAIFARTPLLNTPSAADVWESMSANHADARVAWRAVTHRLGTVKPHCLNNKIAELKHSFQIILRSGNGFPDSRELPPKIVRPGIFPMQSIGGCAR